MVGGRLRGSVVYEAGRKLNALDFANQAMLLGAGLLVSALPFFILLSAFASTRVDDDIARHLGLDRRASTIVTHLITAAPARLNVATATSLLFVLAGTLAVASSLQQIYEKVFGQAHRGMRDLPRLLIWIAVLCGVLASESLVGRPVRNAPGGAELIEIVTFAVLTPFFWWTMHFLLAGRVPWRRLLPSAIATGVFFGLLGVFSSFYFSATIISDSNTYGAIGAVFGILTWLIAIGAVIIIGAVTGAVWYDRSHPSPKD
jgi:membrane protein